MLNEGVHVDDVSGVILQRPTVSPIIYKQQIGREIFDSLQYGNLDVPARHVAENGFKLGTWISNQRESVDRIRGERRKKVVYKTDDRVVVEFRKIKKDKESLESPGYSFEVGI